MEECENNKIHTSSNFVLSICLLIMWDIVFLTPSLYCNTSLHFITPPNYTSLHLSTPHFLSFTLHYPLIWLNPFTFPTTLFHFTSLNKTQYSSPISKVISKVMNPFTALKDLSPFHFTSLNKTQHSSPISKLISKIMNPLTALKNL